MATIEQCQTGNGYATFTFANGCEFMIFNGDHKDCDVVPDDDKNISTTVSICVFRWVGTPYAKIVTNEVIPNVIADRITHVPISEISRLMKIVQEVV